MEIMKQIQDVLWLSWDPIGVNASAPDDEYDSYIGGVYRLLASRCSRDALVNHLLNIEFDAMGLGPTVVGFEAKHRAGLEAVADQLLALDVSMK